MKHELTRQWPTFGRNADHPKREPCRSAKEVLAMFGFKSNQALHYAMNKGTFPQPDEVMAGMTAHKHLYWRLSTLVAEQKRRAEARIDRKQ